MYSIYIYIFIYIYIYLYILKKLISKPKLQHRTNFVLTLLIKTMKQMKQNPTSDFQHSQR